MLEQILGFLPLLVAPFVLIIWSLVSAYVYRLGLKGSGIGYDYVVFTLIMALALVAGGVI